MGKDNPVSRDPRRIKAFRLFLGRYVTHTVGISKQQLFTVERAEVSERSTFVDVNESSAGLSSY